METKQFLKKIVDRLDISKALALSLALVGLSACTESQLDRSHRLGTDTVLTQNPDQWALDTATEAELENQLVNLRGSVQAFREGRANVLALRAEMQGSEVVSAEKQAELQSRVESLYTAAGSELEALALNTEYTGDSALQAQEDYVRVFRHYADVLAFSVRQNPEFGRRSGLLRRFYTAVSVGCGRSRPACRALSLAGRSAQSSFLLEQYALMVNSELQTLAENSNERNSSELLATRHRLIREKFDILFLALKLRNASDDQLDRINVLYLASAMELYELPRSLAPRSEIEMHRHNINLITATLGQRVANPSIRALLQPYMEATNVFARFTLRNRLQQQDIFGSLRAGSDLIKIACQYYRNSDQTRDAINQSLSMRDADGHKGFLSELAEMRSGRNGVILSNMRMTNEIPVSEQLYMIDQVYRGHWDASIAQHCWSARRADLPPAQIAQDEEDFLNLMQSYVRVELIKKVIMTNEFMAQVFTPPAGQQRLASRDVFFRAIEDSKQLKDDWEGMIKKIENLQNFQKLALQRTREEDKTEAYRRLEVMLLGLKNNIKLIAVYPNMLVLCYFLAVKEFSITLQSFWGSITLDDTMIINWILGEERAGNRVARPLFDFGNDSRPIQPFENLYSLFYALKTNTFGTVGAYDRSANASTDQDRAISDMNFFAEVTRRWVNTQVNSVTNNVKELETLMSDTESLELAKRICRFESELTGPQRDQLDLRRPYELRLSLQDLQNFTLVSLGSYGPGRTVGAAVRAPYDMKMKMAASEIRGGMYRKYLFVESMIQITEQHWRDQLEARDAGHAGPFSVENYVDVENKIKTLRNNFSLLMAAIRKSDQIFMARHREVGHCVNAFDTFEVRQQNKLILMEESFLKRVYAGLNEFYQRAGNGEDAALVADLELRYTDAVNGRPDSGGRYDTELLREIAAMAKVYFDQAGDVQGFDEILYRGGYVYSKWNMLLRTRHNLARVNPGVKVDVPQMSVLPTNWLYSDARGTTNRLAVSLTQELPQGGTATLSEADFVKSIISNAVSRNFLNWFGQRNIELIKSKLDTMSEIYANQRLGIYSLANSACANTPNDETCRANNIATGAVAQDRAITPLELANEVLDMNQRIHINAEDERVLRLAFQRTKYDRSKINALFLNSREEPLSIFETLYKSVSEKRNMLEQAQSAVSTFNAMLSTGAGHNNEADQDWETQPARELIFLSEHDSVRKVVRRVYRPTVLGTLKMVKDLENTIDCLAETREWNRPEQRILYELDMTPGIAAESNTSLRRGRYIDPMRGSSRPILLESRLREDYENALQDFDKETRRVFSAKRGDPDFGVAQDERLDCAQVLRAR